MTEKPTVLVPIAIFERESIPEGVPELLANAHVVVLGYHEIPEQTAAEQAHEQFGDRAAARLAEYEEMFRAAGAVVNTRVAFTHEPQQTINRVILDRDCEAVLIPGATVAIEDVLVAVRGSTGADRLPRVVSGLFAGTDATVTLFHVADEAESSADIESLLETMGDRLVEGGIDPDRVRTRVGEASGPLAGIEAVGEEYDVVVMGETDPSVATFVFGLPEKQLAERFLGPVLVVQRPLPER